MWVKASHGYVPAGAIPAGTDTDGSLIYIARAFRRGELLPANLIPSKNCAFTCTCWEMYTEHEYEVLCNEHVTWVPHTSSSPIPIGAIPIGHRDGRREILYMGRVLHDGALIPGKVHSVILDNNLHIPYGGAEIPYDTFEILTAVSSQEGMPGIQDFKGTKVPGPPTHSKFWP